MGEVISITGFKNNTSNPNNDWIGEALADNLTTDLSKVKQFRIVNRNHLKDILTEQKLNYSGLVDENESIELGMLAGADKLLRGDFTILNHIIIVNAYFINLETGVVEHSIKTEGKTNELYFLFKLLTNRLLAELGIEVNEIEQLKISQYDTDNTVAIEKNYKGVIAFDRNEIEVAISHFKEAVNIDPFYTNAKTNLEKSEVKVRGGFLFANAINELDKKGKQQNALKIIVDKFRDNYLMIEIANQSIVTDLNDPKNAFIELELTINQNKDALWQYYKDLLNISGGETEIVDYSDISFDENYFLPSDIFDISDLNHSLEMNTIYLYKENLNWVLDYLKIEWGDYFSTKVKDIGYKKDYKIEIKINKEVIHQYKTTFYLKVTKRTYSNDYDKGIEISWQDETPPSYKYGSNYPYPITEYVYLLIPIDDVVKITSISLKEIR